MSQPKGGFYAIVTAAILFCTLAALTGAKAGQDKNALGGLKIAVVDADKLLSEYSYTPIANKQLQDKQNEADSVLRAWQSNPLLTEQEQTELATLITAENSPAGLTDAQKARKKQLLDESNALLTEFDTLKNKKVGDITPEDNKRLTALMKLGNDTDVRINARAQQSKDELSKMQAKLVTQVQSDVKTALAKVAKEKGYNLVLSSSVAPYGENDITDAVLAQLNKK
jgi:Skp family chaperone for outer membrane proteins